MLRVIKALWKASLLTAMQYRGDFLLSAALSLAWGAWSILPLLFVFGHTEAVEGWAYPQALMVMAFFLCLRGLVDGLIEPNLSQLVSRVRDGTLDFVLLKPADAQLLVSVQRVVPGRIFDVLASVGMVAWCLDRLNHTPTLAQLAGALICLFAGMIILYSLWLVAASTAFWWVRVDSLSYLLGAVLDAGRWPIVVYRGWVKAVLTFVLPVALMTSFPAMALVGLLDPVSAAMALGLAACFAIGSRLIWQWSVGHYTSASS